MFFTDAFERTLDDKKRLQIPAEYRQGLDPEHPIVAFYVVPGERESTLSLLPEQYFREKVASMHTDRIPGPDGLDFEQMFFSLASRAEPDKQGRIVRPERQLAMVELGSELYITGAHYRLDVWRKADYEQFLRDVAPRRASLQSFLRMGGAPPASPG